MFGGFQEVLQDRHRPLQMSNYVSGSQRPFYFKRPLVPQLSDVPLHLAPPQQDHVDNIPQNQQIQQENVELQPKTRDQEVQTMYRESEAQTDPYTPNYVLREGDNPEVLQLEHLKFGKGLPATVEELDNIEINREKQGFDNALPPISDEASFNLRRKLMEVQEVKEWDKKESTIKKHQQEKLYLLQSGLIEREKEVEEKNAQRIEEIKIKKTEQKNKLIAKIQRRKIKVLRKMLKGRKTKDQDTTKRDIIEDYSNFASKVYAGITRDGLSLDKIANKYEVQPVALTSYVGMTELANEIKPSEFEAKIDVDYNLKNIQKNYTRLENHHKQQLKKAQQEIEGKENQQKQQQKANEEIDQNKKNQSGMIRSNTPNSRAIAEYPGFKPLKDNDGKDIKEIEHSDAYQAHADTMVSQDQRQRAIIFLQRLIRGRTLQNIMYEGKEKRLALIDELLTVAQIDVVHEEEAEEILQQNHEEKVKNAVLESIQGEVISETLDGLSKELLRIKQERKINLMVEAAEKDRRLREIHEAGRRQAEETLRKREDVLYNEIMQTHKGTVDTYLDWIMDNTVEKASRRQATIMSNLRRSKLDKPLEKFERKFTNNETIIKDLVHSFLIPNVQRSKTQRQVEIAQKRFNESAKKSIQSSVTKASNNLIVGGNKQKNQPEVIKEEEENQ